jgi:octaprenyl-diphosphate synthase
MPAASVCAPPGAFGGPRLRAPGERHIDAAAIIEFIHTATLLHDDVVDGSSLRRGRETANEVFGNATSVLVGDFLYSRAFQMMVSAGSHAHHANHGRCHQRHRRGRSAAAHERARPEHHRSALYRRHYRKTARLFEAAAQIGAVLSDAPPDHRRVPGAVRRHIGTAFQLVDDALDYQADEASLGKHLGDDLAEGKPTLP